MDVFDWTLSVARQLYANDLEELGDLVLDFPGICLQEHTVLVEGPYLELLQVAEQLEVPWLEVFARHWYLQHQICLRNNIELGLPEAVRLLEIAHREENQGCPQSICAVQDICLAYGGADGPGYAEERRQVCEEAFSRIDPTWQCFECISAEYAKALLDEGRAAEALAYLDAQAKKLPDPTEASSDFQINRATACFLSGEYERALEITKTGWEGGSANNEVQRRCLRAASHSRLGSSREALISMPNSSSLRKLPVATPLWAMALFELVRSGAIPLADARLKKDLKVLNDVAATLAERGGIRHAFNVGAIAVELHLLRGDKKPASEGIERLRAWQSRLRKSCGSDVRLAELEARLAAAG